MKIHLASDLHLEFLQQEFPGERLIAPVPGSDVLVLAGDIAKGADACRLFADWRAAERVPVILLAGNHEFYGHSIDPMYRRLREGAALNNIHFLENDSVVIGGVRFLGCTLWTDYKLSQWHTQEAQIEYCQGRLNDHRLITFGERRFSAQDALDRHLASRAWLEAELDKSFDGKTVVITHHAPHPGSVHPRYANNLLNAAFTSDLTPLVEKADFWFHGHVHDGFDYKVGRCRVVANPMGYIMNRGWATRDEWRLENEAFDRNLLIEV